jgi:hypothetical protein
MTDDTARGSPGRCLKTGTPYDETTARPARPRVFSGVSLAHVSWVLNASRVASRTKEPKRAEALRIDGEPPLDAAIGNAQALRSWSKN